jgi:RES domain-containing protein
MHAARYLAADPTGSMLAPGRWHSQGTRVIYAAQHISLAVLETVVHAAGRKLPPRSLTRITIPERVAVEEASWHDYPASRAFGDLWVREARTAILRVPSILTHRLEHNYVLNPSHPDFQKIRFAKPEVFELDPRFVLFS